MNTRERDRVIDIMKGLGIILMIYGHTHYIPVIGKWLYTFHMPLFFFLSGCFFSGNFNFKRNCQRIILPYFSFAIIMCIVTLFVSIILAIWNHINATDVVVDKLNDFKSNIIQALYGDETSLFFKTLWFLPICLLDNTKNMRERHSLCLRTYALCKYVPVLQKYKSTIFY